METKCDCGEVIEVSLDEVLNFAITICPRCDAEVSLEEMYDDAVDMHYRMGEIE